MPNNLYVPDISIEGFYLNYRQQSLFSNFNFHLARGKCYCLLGPSGIGKTSLLRFIAGLEEDFQDATYHGTVLASDNKPLTSRIAYMAQKDLLLPWLSVIENVLIGYRLRQEKVDKELKRRALELLYTVGLAHTLALRPASLSSGMRQRVALVRTLLEDRPIVLMDEPFAALDAITRLKLQDFAAELLQERTVLLVTHDPLEALRLGDYIYILQGIPVRLSAPFKPSGIAPRNPADEKLLALQVKLLERLGLAQAALRT